MHIAFLSTIISAGALAFLTALFSVEARRGERFLPRAREAFDRGVVWFFDLVQRGVCFLEKDIIRFSVHYIFHGVLRFFQEVLRVLDRHVGKLIHVNRSIATKERRQSDPSTQLGRIAEHKASVALSDEEKKEYKERSIGTRL